MSQSQRDLRTGGVTELSKHFRPCKLWGCFKKGRDTSYLNLRSNHYPLFYYEGEIGSKPEKGGRIERHGREVREWSVLLNCPKVTTLFTRPIPLFFVEETDKRNTKIIFE